MCVVLQDQAIYESSMSWFLRGPITFMTGFSGTSHEFHKLFPAPKEPIEAAFTAALQ